MLKAKHGWQSNITKKGIADPAVISVLEPVNEAKC